MRRVFLTIMFMTGLSILSFGQDHSWAFGFYGDMSVKSAKESSFGVQGKYDLNSRNSVQGQVHGRSNFVSVGADYLFSFLDKRKSNFNVFLGAGATEDFVRYQDPGVQEYVFVKDERFVLNGQLGLSYYFKPVQLSVYTGYKVKYLVEDDTFLPNYLTLGVRYHLW
ncbi:hypothetical protein SAMN05660841_00767 [Sphingobacterium nematocida]|uniref:Outer membrane protein beta-barrel domain-containing protein n=1 Tax=Sphingobacterium nematocida TaxID=1513896 RepID=A0A1T5BKW5_9SPHI|nr:hypothetical protein [Sphingobacterium nematocida]SKB47815.1 hypothetical protein SAMN05660841_00767 [Sphingobacterium nematocida]